MVYGLRIRYTSIVYSKKYRLMFIIMLYIGTITHTSWKNISPKIIRAINPKMDEKYKRGRVKCMYILFRNHFIRKCSGVQCVCTYSTYKHAYQSRHVTSIECACATRSNFCTYICMQCIYVYVCTYIHTHVLAISTL